MVTREMGSGRRWTLGVDCGEQKHRFVLLNEKKERQKARWVENRKDAIHTALMQMMILVPEGYRMEIVTEGLRSIGGMITQVATEFGVAIFQVNPKALERYRELEGQPRKTDDRDGDLLARMRVNKVEGCRLALDVLPEERVLCRLTRLRTQLVRQRDQARARLRSRLLELSPEIVGPSWEGPKYDSQAMLAVLERWPGYEGLERAQKRTIEGVLRPATRRSPGLEKMTEALRVMARRIGCNALERTTITMELEVAVSQLRFTAKSLSKVEREIKRAVESHPAGPRLLEMPGVGHFVAGVLIGEALPLARNESEGKAATYCGLTPLSRRSGKMGGPSKLARGVNKHAVRVLYISAVSASRCSSLDRAYYLKQFDRHQGHPKAHVKSFLALARQRFKVMYKLLTTEARYDKETLIRSHLERQALEQKKTKERPAA